MGGREINKLQKEKGEKRIDPFLMTHLAPKCLTPPCIKYFERMPTWEITQRKIQNNLRDLKF